MPEDHFLFITFSYLDQMFCTQSSSLGLSKVESLEIQALGEKPTTSQHGGDGSFTDNQLRVSTSCFHKKDHVPFLLHQREKVQPSQ